MSGEKSSTNFGKAADYGKNTDFWNFKLTNYLCVMANFI